MNLRRVLTALAVLALFVGLASAQVVAPTPINCSVSAAAPSLRSEGITEKPGDVLIACTGGPTPTAGNAADRATVTIDFGGVLITSRSNNNVTDNNVKQNITEALLLIDEPGSCNGPVGAACTLNAGFPSTPDPAGKGYGQNANIVVCTAVQQRTGGIQDAANCPTFAQNIGGFWVLDTSAVGAVTHAANAYQGVTPNGSNNNTKLTFLNVPIVSTAASNVSREYRLVNARLSVGSAASITANVTVTPNNGAITTLNVTNNAVAAGTPTNSLTTSMTTTGGATLCTSTDLGPVAGKAKANLALLAFTEKFGTAFKTRTLPLASAAGAAENGGIANQVNATGNYTTVYTPVGGAATNISVSTAQSESGFVVQALQIAAGPPATVAGLADSGTRFKAVFKGLSSKATYYVSQFNVADYSNEAAAPATIGNADPTPYAVLIGQMNPGDNAILSETVPSVAVPLAAFGTLVNAPPAPTPGGVHVVTLTPDGSGNAEVVWEVTNASTAVDTFNFALYAVYNNVTGAPPVGNNGTVALGYAPTNGSGNSTTTNAWIPRFTAPSAAQNVFVTIPCQTTLLFPFVSNTRATPTTHWETGIAIVNTGADPWGSVPVVSPASTTTTCTLDFYGPSAPPSMTTPAIGPGTSYAFTVSDPLSTGAPTVTSFSGYLFAVCNFQFAHGFSFVEDDTRSMAMGYLALVVDNGSGIVRAAALTGERLSH